MKKIKRLAAVILSAATLASAAALAACDKGVKYIYPDKVSVYETTGTKASLLGRKSSIEFTELGGDYTRQKIYVGTDNTYQSYTGYGASMTHASAYLLMRADEETRSDILKDLFSREGANFSVVRIPVGASDYIAGEEYFTCDDLEEGQTDPSLEKFNLENDKELITVLRQIKKINPAVRFMASPWSAPAWMKQNSSLLGGGSLKEDMYETYADYLVKFVSEYKKLGIDISMLTLLNEPSVGALSYPTMDMTAIEASVITEYTGKKLEEAGIKADIVSWDFNYGSSSSAYADTYFEALYEDGAKTSGKYTNTVGFHGYDGDGYFNPETAYGMRNGIQKISEYNKASLITEITESAASKDFASNLTYSCKNVVVNPCAVQTDDEDNAWNGCGGALYWNFVLDGDGGPTPASHGGNECYGVITLDEVTRQGQTTFKYEKSSAYYAMAHVSRFLYEVDGVPCRALKATVENGIQGLSDVCVLSYYRNDGAIITVVCNTNDQTGAAIDVVIGDKQISYDMVPQSVVTFVC